MFPASTVISVYRNNDQVIVFRVSGLGEHPYDLEGGAFWASVYSGETPIHKTRLDGEDYAAYTLFAWAIDRYTTVDLARVRGNLAFRLTKIAANGEETTFLTGAFRVLSHPDPKDGETTYDITVSDQDTAVNVVVGDASGDALQARVDRIAAQAAAAQAQVAADAVTGAQDALALAATSVQPDRSIIAGEGLAEGGTLLSDVTLALSEASLASLAKADSAIPRTRKFSAGDGLTGGGDGTSDLTFSLDDASQAALVLAQRSRQAVASRAAIAGLSIPAGIDKLSVGGWATEGDTPTVDYAYAALEPMHDAKARSSNGRWFGAEAGKTVFQTVALFFAATDPLGTAWKAAPGHIVEAEGLQFRNSPGALAIAAAPGWVPNGPATPAHWGGSGAAQIAAAQAYAASVGTGPAKFDGNLTLDQNYWYALPGGNIATDGVGELVGATGFGGPNFFKLIDSAPAASWINFHGRVFDYEKVLPFRRGLRITGADTLGNVPNPGPDYLGYYGGFETSLEHDVVLNESGYNGDAGEPGRTNYSMYRPCLYQEGAGDAVVYRPLVRVGDGSGTGAAAVDKPSGAVYGGTIYAASDYIRLTYGEFHFEDQGRDVSVEGPNFVFERNNAAEENECSWSGFRMYSAGSEAVNIGFYFAGRWKSGIDFSNCLLTNGVAVALKKDQYIDLNGTHSRWPNRNTYRDQLPSGWKFGYTASEDAIEVYADGAAVARFGTDKVIFRKGADNPEIVGIQGAVATDELTFGRSGTDAVVRAAAGGTDDANLTVHTTLAGVTEAAFTVDGAGNLNLHKDGARLEMRDRPVLICDDGDPEGVVSATVGAIYLRTDGGVGATIYVKETGGSGSTGWAAK
ncbi:hypothetical protein DLJ53_21805 [Acuticoccus sediminis]|uniref:Uncharacterized protein n=1 Tax=Acuticoccus sediminis TaxID=2184697 RepID=A0A8B2NI10_9HYPH|nr:hypothetical protein [Acuticoccus sediminis]RAH99184.1 hypothetical protein DLJ53_21805 [Acuticoccus sediminis]